jgi:uncharacterized protein YndB with AHSA1/START domain
VAICGWLGVLAGVLGAAGAIILLAVEPAVGRDRFSYPFTPAGFVAAQVLFSIQHLGLLAGLYGLWRSGAVGTSRVGWLGCWGAIVGMGLLSVMELVAISGSEAAYPSPQANMIESLYGIPSVLIGLSLIAAGIAVIRARRWHGWRRALPLLLGVYVFVPLTPALFASYVAARLAIGGWMLGFAFLGWALIKVARETPVATGVSVTPMIKVDESVVIDRPAEDVFAYVSDGTNAPRWQRGLREVRRTTEGPIGVGTRHTVERDFMGRRLTLTNEFTRYEPNTLVAFDWKGTVPGQASYIVEPVEMARTKLTSRVEMRPSGLLRLAEPVMAAGLARDVKANLVTLKRLLEGNVPTSDSDE